MHALQQAKGWRARHLQGYKGIQLRAVVEKVVHARAKGATQQRHHAPREALPGRPPCKAPQRTWYSFYKLSSDLRALGQGQLMARAPGVQPRREKGRGSLL